MCKKFHCDKIAISHGAMSSTLIKPGEWVTVVCDEGYKYSHPGSYFYCNPLSLALEGTVGLCQPEKSRCPEIKPKFGSAEPKGPVLPNTWVKINCYPGFIFTGESPFIFCSRNGTYKENKGNCARSDILSCSLMSMKNVVRRSTVRVGEKVDVVCSPGFVYSRPSASHVCTQSAAFQPPLGTCYPENSCYLSKILHSSMKKNEVIPAGSWARIACLSGFHYSLLESTHVCQANGKLEPELGKCTSHRQMTLTCPPIHISHSIPLAAVRAGTWVRVQCSPNYRYTLVKKIHICLNTGQYTPSIGSCVPHTVSHCAGPIIAHSLTPLSPVPVESWVKVECEKGYSYSRSNYLHFCLADGSYDIPLGECVRSSCSHANVLNGKTVVDSNDPIDVGSLVQIKCNAGYSYSLPSSVHFCGINLKLEPLLGNCELVQCPELEVENAMIVPTKKPHAFQSVFIICLTGHEFVGESPALSCLPDGSYEGEIGLCRNKKDKSLHQDYIEAGFLTKAVYKVVYQNSDNNFIESSDNNFIESSDNNFIESRPTTNTDSTSNEFKISDKANRDDSTNSDVSQIVESLERKPEFSYNALTLFTNQVVTSDPGNLSDKTRGMGRVQCLTQTVLHGQMVPSGAVGVNTTVKVECFEGFLYNKSGNLLKCNEMGTFVPAVGSCVSTGELLV